MPDRTKEKKPRMMYVHTIEGKPATWSERDGQLVFVDDDRWRDRATNATLRASVRQIRRDQARSIEQRKAWKFNDQPGRYGYVRVLLPLEGASDAE